MIILVCFVVVATTIWQLSNAMRSGEITALGGISSSAQRSRTPVRFWLFVAHNIVFLVCGAFLLVLELRS